MDTRNFREKAITHHKRVRAKFLKRRIAPQKKSALVREAKALAEDYIPAPLLKAIKAGYTPRTVRSCNAAHLAHLTRGTYDEYLIGFKA